MSAVCVFTPVVVDLAWPVVSSAIASALVSAGYAAAQTDGRDAAQEAAAERVELAVPQAQDFGQSLGEEEELSLRRGSVTLTFHKDADGRLKVCASGQGLSQDELRAAGQEALNLFMQEYVRRKVVDELKKRGFSMQEERLADGSLRISAKSWK